MKIIKTDFDGLFLLKANIFEDSRGYFYESFNKESYNDHIENVEFVQDNESISAKGVIRGLHFQNQPFSQSKLLRVVTGSILDVAVDLRNYSNTFGKYFSIKIHHSDKIQIYIPRGFAHGFIALEDNTIVNYKVDNFYSPNHENGINPFDKSLNIDWIIEKSDIKISEKDSNLPDFNKKQIF